MEKLCARNKDCDYSVIDQYRRLDTLGRNLDQKVLIELAKEVFPDGYKETLNAWKRYTLSGIVSELLFSTNDYYMEEAFDIEQVMKINDLIVKLRTT